ncbi:hypothetical protein BDW75DRAFT_245621 [Aspergillus navahoensis]
MSGIVCVVLFDRYDRHIPADSTYSVLFCISTIEVGLAFVAACAPSLKPLVMKLIPKLLSTRSRSGEQYNHGTGTSGRMLYDLGPLSRSRRIQQGVDITSVEAREDETAYSNRLNRKDRIMMTTETEVKWDDSPTRGLIGEGSSTESLVQLGR